MKKETIEKLFKRYISIFDNVVYQITNNHLDESIINEINSEVDLIFKEYEQITTLKEFSLFSKKIQDIINKIIDKSDNLNTELIKNEFKKTLNLFENNPFIYIEKEVDKTIKLMRPTSNGDYYIPYNPYLESITKKGYNAVFKFDKIQEHIKNVNSIYKAECDKINDINEKEYQRLLLQVLNELNDYPIQFCKETIEQYFYDDLFNKLLLYPNSIKNQFIIEAISNKLKPHTQEYENNINLLFKNNTLYKDNIINGKSIETEVKNNFLHNIIDKTIINTFIQNWEALIFNNTNLTKSDKKNLLKKYNIIKININKFTDASIIRFYNFTKAFNGGGSANLKSEFAIGLSDESFLTMIINLVNMELSILVNELETIKLDKNLKQFCLIGNYSNIINDYYKLVDTTNNTKIDDNISISEAQNIKKQLDKVNILHILIENFDNQYNYTFTNIKTNITNFIQKLKF